MSDIDINVLMIGKSGTGKSSLLNYIYGSKVEKTGSGRPVTEKGIYEHITSLNKTSKLHIYDTWGLEPDKADEWNYLIREEIKKRNVIEIREWFHFIIYCINAKSARIEEFEESFIRKLLEDNNKIIIALTQCDDVNTDVLQNMKTCLFQLGLEKDNVVCVCSVEKSKIGGVKTKPFGKEQLLQCIQQNFWKNICERIPKAIYEKAEEELGSTSKWLKNYIESEIKFFNMHSNRKYKKINEYCNTKYRETFDKINQYADNLLQDSINYYYAVCDFFALGLPGEKCQSKKELPYKISFYMDFSEKFTENLAMAIMALIPLVNLFVPVAMKEMKIDEYKSSLDRMHQELIEESKKLCEDVTKQLSEIEGGLR